MPSVITPSVIMPVSLCRVSFMISVEMKSIMLSVIIPIVIMLNVVEPFEGIIIQIKNYFNHLGG